MPQRSWFPILIGSLGYVCLSLLGMPFLVMQYFFKKSYALQIMHRCKLVSRGNFPRKFTHRTVCSTAHTPKLVQPSPAQYPQLPHTYSRICLITKEVIQKLLKEEHCLEQGIYTARCRYKSQVTKHIVVRKEIYTKQSPGLSSCFCLPPIYMLYGFTLSFLSEQINKHMNL